MNNETTIASVYTNHTKKRTSPYINLISFILVLALSVILVILLIGYRDSKIGLLTIGGLAGIGLGAAIFFYPELGAYVLAITVFSNISSIFTDAGLPGLNKPLVALTFASIIAGRFVRRQPFRVQRTEWLLLGYAAVALASTFFAKDRIVAIDTFIDLVKNILILITLIYSLQTTRQWKTTIWLMIGTITIIALLGIFQVLTGNFSATFGGFATVTPDVTQMRLSGPIGDPNFWAQILTSVMVLALYRFITDKMIWGKIMGGVATAILLFVILNSYSRGAFLAMSVIFVFTIIQRRVSMKKLIIVVAMVMIIIPLSMPLLPEGFTERMQTLMVFTNDDKTTAVQQDKSFQGRSSEMLSGILMFFDHPILGVGIGNYEGNYQSYAQKLGLEFRTEYRQAHSLYVEIIAEMGILGILMFLAVIISLFAQFRHSRKLLANIDEDWLGWLASVQIAILSYLTTSIFLHGDFFRYLIFLIAVGVAGGHISRKLWEASDETIAPVTIAAQS